jgi:hypothetical protein
MRDVRRFYIAVVYILSQYCGVKRVSKWRGGYSGETSRTFPLWEIQPGYTLAHSA